MLYIRTTLMDAGNERRRASPSQRRGLCPPAPRGGTHTRHADAHHIRHWAEGSETKLSNLVELCGRHHRLQHEGGYKLKSTDDGALVFTRPNGERIPDVPRPLTLSGDPIERFEAEHRRLRIRSDTHPCRWDGRRPDYGIAIDILAAKARVSAGTSTGN